MKKIFLLLLVVLFTTNIFASSEVAKPEVVACKPSEAQGRRPASAEECTGTATELMSVETEQAQFAKICKEIVKSDPACLKLKPEKRLKCTNQNQNLFFTKTSTGGKDQLDRIYQCIKGFAWDSMVELGKFVVDMIKMMVNGAIDSTTGIIKFMTDSDYRADILGKTSKFGKFAKAFLNSSAMYFSREYAKNLASNPLNPMAALGKTLFEPLMKFISEAVTSMIAEYTPQWHCMNGAAKLNTVCRLAGEFVMPPAFIFGFMKHGVVGLKALSKSPVVGRFTKNFAAMNQVADKTEDVIDLVQDAKGVWVDPKLAKGSKAAKSSKVKEANAPAPAVVKRSEKAKDITKHSDKELVQLARNERKLASAEGGVPAKTPDVAPQADNLASIPKDPEQFAKAFPQTSDAVKFQLPKLKPAEVQKLVGDIKAKFPTKVSDDDIGLMIRQFGKQGAKTPDEILKRMDSLQVAKVENPSLFAKDGVMNQGALVGESEMTKLLYVDEISKRGIPRRDPAGNFKVGKNGKIERIELPKDRIEKQRAIRQEMEEFSKAVDCKI